jgi:RNA polymerase sigma-70 factor, ECF subfamily
MVRFACTILGRRDEAEDVVQDVLANLWDRADRWQPSANPVAYLFSSVRNQALNSTRRKGRDEQRARDIRVSGAHTEQDAESSSDPLVRLINSESEATHVRLVSEVLASCTERQRTAYDLRYRRGLTAQGIAEVLGITVKSAEQLVGRTTHLIVERLREKIEALD